MTSSPGLLALLLAVPLATAPAPRPAPDHALARAILKELVEIDTTDSTGNVTRAAEAVAARLRAAGFPAGDVHVDGPVPKKRNLVARLRGTGERRPVLLLAHLDVVEARRSDWSPDLDPFALTERDGFFYGRGTSDVKHGAAILITTLIDLRRAGFVPDRDVILALTADEEGGESNGVAWLLGSHRDWIDAAYCVNTDGGDFQAQGGRRRLAAIQASEKLFVSVDLTARDAGGHSSMPGRENAIVRLAGALTRLGAHVFPAALNDVTRETFARMARVESGTLAADLAAVARTPPDPSALARLSSSPYFNALLRTTCVPTLLDGGHAENALPQLAKATVNCRLLPGEAPEAVLKEIVRVVADPAIAVTFTRAPRPASPPSTLEPELVRAVETTAGAMWPGLPVVPVMETGGTDGSWLRPAGIPTFGVSGVFLDMDDVRAHGKDERVGIAAFDEGLTFYETLVRALTSGR